MRVAVRNLRHYHRRGSSLPEERFVKRPLLLVLACVLVCLEAGAQPLATGGYSARDITLREGVLRLDLGPPDYGFMDLGELNNDRGALRVGKDGDAFALTGFGAGYGILDELEVGTLIFPLLYAPDFDFGDIEFYGRYAFFSRGKVRLAAQFTMQVPTHSDFGIGFGMPAIFELGTRARLDTGVELEVLFDDTRANLDIPLAFAFEVGRTGFIGPRTGFRLPRFEAVAVPLGIFGGATINERFDLTASFNWPRFLTSAGNDAVGADVFEFIFGLNMYFDLKR